MSLPGTALGLLLSRERVDLESIPVDELRAYRDLVLHRVEMARIVGAGGGAVATLAAIRILRRLSADPRSGDRG